MVSYLQGTSVFRGIFRNCKDLQPSLLKLLRCLALFLPLLLSSASYAQSNYASLSGTVVDPDEKVVPAAVVTLTALNTHAARQATSNEQGTFQFTGLLPGEYKLDLRSTNFASLSQTVRLEVGQQMTLTLKLEVGSLNTTVNVMNESTAVLRTTDSSIGEVVERRSVQNLPLNGRMIPIGSNSGGK